MIKDGEYLKELFNDFGNKDNINDCPFESNSNDIMSILTIKIMIIIIAQKVNH